MKKLCYRVVRAYRELMMLKPTVSPQRFHSSQEFGG